MNHPLLSVDDETKCNESSFISELSVKVWSPKKRIH